MAVLGVPVEPYAVKVYVVVDVGQTDCEPDVVTLPTTEIFTEVQLVVFHESEDEPPAVIDDGLAVKLLIEHVGTTTGTQEEPFHEEFAVHDADTVSVSSNIPLL